MLVPVFVMVRRCAWLNPPQLLLSWARAKVRDAPAARVPVKLSVMAVFPGEQNPTSAPDLPARVMVPVKSAPLFLTVRNPVSTEAPSVVPSIQTLPELPLVSQIC